MANRFWARERNFSKMRLSAMIETLKALKDLHSTTRIEAEYLNSALHTLSTVYRDWEKAAFHSRRKFEDAKRGA